MQLSFGNRTIPNCWIPGFASPPHDGFAFIGLSPHLGRRKNGNQRVQSAQGVFASSHLLADESCIILPPVTIRDQLLDAAARLYSESGYRGATTRRIAEQAGVNEVTLFRHFGSKDSLIREAISRAGSGLTPEPLPSHPREPFRELRDWARAHIAEMRQRRSLIRTCMGEIEEHPGIFSGNDSPPALAAKALSRYLRRLREANIAKAPFDEVTASTMLMGVLFADAMGRDIMPDMYRNDPDEALEQYVRLFLRGIGVGVRRSA